MAKQRPGRMQETVVVNFPLAGLDTSAPYSQQPNRAIGNGGYARTTRQAVNVRGYEASSGVNRGGQRAGLSKHLADQVNGSASIQLIDHVVATEIAQGHQVVETITSTQTWTCPAGVTSVQVECWGGGAGGTSGWDAGGGASGGGGGGGGAYSIKAGISVTPGTGYTATVGTGGAGGVVGGGGTTFGNGTAGGDSWFSSTGTVLAKGGSAASADTAGSGGASASGVGDTKYSGGNGANGSSSLGGGGGSSAGTAAAGGNASTSTGGTAPSGGGAGGNGKTNSSEGPGSAGSTPGGAGGGGYGDGNTPSGGAGARGQIKLTYTQIATLGVRGIVGVTVAGGTVKKFDDDGLASVTNGSTALSTTRQVMFGSQLFNNYFFADGSNYKYLNVTTDTVSTWTATAGTLPTDAASNKPLLIATCMGRLWLSGLQYDSHNWFASALGDAFDWDYSPATVVSTQAVAGNNSPAGHVDDIITSIAPFADDVLIFGGDHTVYQLSGDPMAGGRIDKLSDAVGFAFGRPFCKGPDGAMYFFANQGGVFRLTPGSRPQQFSNPIWKQLRDIDVGTNIISMAWCDYEMHVFITPLDSTAAATHYAWEADTNAWWKIQYANPNHNPKVVHVFDGDDPEDRSVLLGTWSGYINKIDEDAADDDGTTISSEVWIGPLLTKDSMEMMLTSLQPIMSQDSGDVSYAVYTGRSAEEAFGSAPKVTGTFLAGRNYSSLIQRAGHAIYVRLSAKKPWAMELLRVRLGQLGAIRARGR